MRALTVWQPWASLIATGHKTVETRTWAPPQALIGERIAIHAAKTTVALRGRMPAEIHQALSADVGYDWRFVLPLGAMVATARLVGTVRFPDLPTRRTRSAISALAAGAGSSRTSNASPSRSPRAAGSVCGPGTPIRRSTRSRCWPTPCFITRATLITLTRTGDNRCYPRSSRC